MTMFNKGDICKVVKTYEHPVHKTLACRDGSESCDCNINGAATLAKDCIVEILEPHEDLFFSPYVTAWIPQLQRYIFGTFASHFVKISK